jgi:hypothetical protein
MMETNGVPQAPYTYSAFGPYRHSDGTFEYEVSVINLTGKIPNVCARAHVRCVDSEGGRILLGAIAEIIKQLPAPLIQTT